MPKAGLRGKCGTTLSPMVSIVAEVAAVLWL